mgnify:CR=1 FL=1
MAEPFLSLLKEIVERLKPLQIDGVMLETKHFFSGAALYANGKIFASLSPAGFAIKLPPDRRKKLIEGCKGKEFRFFPKGPIKKEYLALSDLIISDDAALRELIESSVNYALGVES